MNKGLIRLWSWKVIFVISCSSRISISAAQIQIPKSAVTSPAQTFPVLPGTNLDLPISTRCGVANLRGCVAADFWKPVILPKGATLVGENRYSIVDRRPMAVVVQLLSQKLGAPISYEDGLSLGSNFEFTLPMATPKSQASTPESIIQSVIDGYNRSHDAGHFKLIRFGEGEFSIVGDVPTDIEGIGIPQLLPLDKRITFPAMRRSLFEAVFEICRVAGLDDNASWSAYDGNNYTNIGAENEKVRDVLARLLGRNVGPLGHGRDRWLVFRYPLNGHVGYSLNLESILYEVTGPDGTNHLEQATWPADR